MPFISFSVHFYHLPLNSTLHTYLTQQNILNHAQLQQHLMNIYRMHLTSKQNWWYREFIVTLIWKIIGT